MYAISGGGAGSVAVNVGGGVFVFDKTTNASVGDGAAINAESTAAGPPDVADATQANQSVLVASGSDTHLVGVAGAVAIGGSLAVTPGVAVNVIDETTNAVIGKQTDVYADRDVTVAAVGRQDVIAVAAGVAGSGTAAVGVSAAVLALESDVNAELGTNATNAADRALVQAGGNVVVSAVGETETTQIAGSLGVGLGAAGVGGAAAVTVIEKTTNASIGDYAIVDAKGHGGAVSARKGEMSDSGAMPAPVSVRGVVVQATSKEDVFQVAASAAGGKFAGVAGGVTVEVLDSDTTARIGGNTTINAGTTNENAAQDVVVVAINEVDVFALAGGVGLGLGALGGGIDVGVDRNDTSAVIGPGSTVEAKQDVAVAALVDKDVTTIGASAGIGGVGVAASLSVWNIGSSAAFNSGYTFDDSNGAGTTKSDTAISSDKLNTVFSNESQSSANQGNDVSSGFGSNLDGYDDKGTGESGTASLGRVKSGAAGATPSNLISSKLGAQVSSGTVAAVSENVTINAGRDIDVRGEERLEYLAVAGSLAAGGAGLGAAIVVLDINSGVRAEVKDGAQLSAGRNINVNAEYDNELEAYAIAGAAAGGAALGAQVVYFDDDSSQLAQIGDGTPAVAGPQIFNAIDVNVTASADRIHDLMAVGGALAGGAAIGAAVAVSNIEGKTEAFIKDADVGQSTGTVGNVTVHAEAIADVNVETTSVAGGIGLAASGSVAIVTYEPKVDAALIDGGAYTLTGDLEVLAESIVDADAIARNVAVSASVALGAAVALASVTPVVNARARRETGANDFFIDAAGDVTFLAQHNTKADGSFDTTKEVSAESFAGSGGLAASLGGSVAHATSDATVGAAVGGSGESIDMTSRGDVTIGATSYNSAASDASGVTVALGLGVGISDSRATASGTTTTMFGARLDGGQNYKQLSNAKSVADVDASSAGLGLRVGQGTTSVATVKPTTKAAVGAGAEVADVAGAVTVRSQAETNVDVDATGFSVA
ncbi:MAG TPA: hypothetical protein VGE52_07970, partial [Pirellulales bacterium]